MGSGVGIRQVGYFDCAGGGQVVVENSIAYVAHMKSPHGTSIIDVSDPKNPKELATLGMPGRCRRIFAAGSASTTSPIRVRRIS